MNDGSEYAPWALTDVLADSKRQFAQPGDTIRLLPGVYRWPIRSYNLGFQLVCRGEVNAPITFEGNWQASIDGGLHSKTSAVPSSIRLRGIEFYTTENIGSSRKVVGVGSDTYRLLNRPSGNVNFPVGTDIGIINCVIHDATGGVEWWSTSTGFMYGNIIFNNGWQADDRKHGHGLYTQNSAPGWKSIRRNIFTQSWDMSVQIYASGQGSACDRFELTENLAYDSGTIYIQPVLKAKDLTFDGNVYHNGSIAGSIAVSNYENVRAQNNVGIGGFAVARCFEPLDVKNNLNWQTGWRNPRLDNVEVPIPNTRHWFFPNEYYTHSATVAIHNYMNVETYDVSLAGWAKAGDVVRLYDPTKIMTQDFKRIITPENQTLTLTSLTGLKHKHLVLVKELDPCYSTKKELEEAQRRIADQQEELQRIEQERTSLQETVSRLNGENDAMLQDLRMIRGITQKWGD